MNKVLPIIAGIFIAGSVSTGMNSSKNSVYSHNETNYIQQKDGTIVDYSYIRNRIPLKQNPNYKTLAYTKNTVIKPLIK